MSFIGDGEDAPISRLTRWTTFPLRFHRGQFGGLILGHLLGTEMSEIDLEWCNGNGGGDDNLQRLTKKSLMPSLENIPSTNAPNQKQRCFECGQKHVSDTLDHEGIENCFKVITDHKFAIDHIAAGRCLQPRVRRHNPEDRQVRPKSDHDRRKVVNDR